MGQVESRLKDMGLTVPEVVPPVAAYVPAVVDGARVYTSGQLPMIDGAMPYTGKVGEGEGMVSPEQAKELARYCALNAIAALKSVVGDLDKIERIVKVVGFVAADPSFTAVPGVINGASELLGAAFGDKGVHARSAVGVAVLPLNASVEVELIAALADD
ncbi:RidA family protein [Gephyromycinifex aptenodytis]|uniref:RidA family protein n=1 Tax=Gephyromycinifex aptenodytis TaxID=2716227 RepID=UPI0014456B75|nr:RidA family protein [Gephyromycinifex aptenodytis]